MEIINKFLTQLDISFNKRTLSIFFSTHPYHPSLLSISDLLDDFGVDNAAVKINKENFSQIPVPFIAKTQSSEGDYCLVKKNENDHVTYFNEKNKWVTVSLNNFFLQYSGVVLVAEKSITSIEPNYKKNRKKYQLENAGLIIALGSILIVSVLWFISCHNTANIVQSILMLLIKFIGICVSVLLLIQSFHLNNPFVNKLCSSASGNGCNNILNSKAAKILWGRSSWSEVGFFYFTSTFFAICFWANDKSIFITLALLNLTALPYTIYSIIYQYKIAKIWCRLCLSIQILLWMEFFTDISFIREIIFFTDIFYSSLKILSVIIIFLSLWLIIKPIIIRYLSIDKLLRDINQFKKDEGIFKTLLGNQPEIDNINKRYNLSVGNPNANFQITFVSNPFCQPCADMHKQIKLLLNDERENLKINFIYTPSTNPDDPKNKIIKEMIAIFLIKGSIALEKAMQEWYSHGIYNSEKWITEHGLNKTDPIHINSVFEGHRMWCEENNISHTPSLFINNHNYLSEYTFTDLKYFIQSAARNKYDKTVQMV